MELQHAFLALIGLGLAVAGPVHLVKLRRAWRRRTRLVRGEIVGHETRHTHDSDGIGTEVDHAVVAYEVGGRRYTTVSRYGASWIRPRPGEVRTVACDPRNPADGEVLSDVGRRLEAAMLVAAPVAGIVLMSVFGPRLFG